MEHHMHSEFYRMEAAEAAEKVNRAKDERCTASSRVGTTSCKNGGVSSRRDMDILHENASGWTEIFIYPGYKFKVTRLA